MMEEKENSCRATDMKENKMGQHKLKKRTKN